MVTWCRQRLRQLLYGDDGEPAVPQKPPKPVASNQAYTSLCGRCYYKSTALVTLPQQMEETLRGNSCAVTVLLSAVGGTMYCHISHQKLLECLMHHCSHSSDSVPCARSM